MRRVTFIIAAAALLLAACVEGDPTVSSADGIPAAAIEAVEDVPDTAAPEETNTEEDVVEEIEQAIADGLSLIHISEPTRPY